MAYKGYYTHHARQIIFDAKDGASYIYSPKTKVFAEWEEPTPSPEELTWGLITLGAIGFLTLATAAIITLKR